MIWKKLKLFHSRSRLGSAIALAIALIANLPGLLVLTRYMSLSFPGAMPGIHVRYGKESK